MSGHPGGVVTTPFTPQQPGARPSVHSKVPASLLTALERLDQQAMRTVQVLASGQHGDPTSASSSRPQPIGSDKEGPYLQIVISANEDFDTPTTSHTHTTATPQMTPEAYLATRNQIITKAHPALQIFEASLDKLCLDPLQDFCQLPLLFGTQQNSFVLTKNDLDPTTGLKTYTLHYAIKDEGGNTVYGKSAICFTPEGRGEIIITPMDGTLPVKRVQFDIPQEITEGTIATTLSRALQAGFQEITGQILPTLPHFAKEEVSDAQKYILRLKAKDPELFLIFLSQVEVSIIKQIQTKTSGTQAKALKAQLSTGQRLIRLSVDHSLFGFPQENLVIMFSITTHTGHERWAIGKNGYIYGYNPGKQSWDSKDKASIARLTSDLCVCASSTHTEPYPYRSTHTTTSHSGPELKPPPVPTSARPSSHSLPVASAATVQVEEVDPFGETDDCSTLLFQRRNLLLEIDAPPQPNRTMTWDEFRASSQSERKVKPDSKAAQHIFDALRTVKKTEGSGQKSRTDMIAEMEALLTEQLVTTAVGKQIKLHGGSAPQNEILHALTEAAHHVLTAKHFGTKRYKDDNPADLNKQIAMLTAIRNKRREFSQASVA